MDTIFSKKVLALLAVGLSSPALVQAEEIELSEVPERVRTVAREAVPGIELKGAEIEEEDGELVYELSGVLVSEGATRRYEIEVSESGELLEVESEEDEEEDDEAVVGRSA